MTEEEFSALFDAEETALLGELGDTLRATPVPELPADFARETARSAEQRFQRLPAITRAALALEPVLGSPVASPKAFPFTVGLLGGTVFGGVLGQQAIGDLGLALLAVVLIWKVLSLYCLPLVGDRARRRWPAANFSFYLLPLACALLTSVVCGGVVSALGMFSINLKTASWNTVLLGPVAGLAMFLYLLSALLPTWKALQRHSVGRARWLYPIQAFHAGWAGLLGSLLTSLYDPKVSLLWVWGTVLGLAAIVSLSLSVRPKLEEEGRPALWRALSKSVRSLAIGGLPVGAILVGAYEATLTRRVEQPALYASVTQDVQAWVAEQQALKPQDNGWTELRSAMTYRSQPGKSEQAPELVEQLKAGSELREPMDSPDYRQKPDSKKNWENAHQLFLKAIPALDSALAKPHFSYISTEGFKMQSRVPNFLLARAGSRGLSALASEAIDQQQSELALEYQLRNLKWSACLRQGALISMMIGVAQENIAIENVEKWVFQTHPDVAQLRRMLAGLQAYAFDRRDLQATMKRETSMADVAFTELLENNQEAVKEFSESEDTTRLRILLAVLPRSYWKSEHQAYLNVMLANLEAQGELGRPNDTDPGQLLPFSFVARQVAPMTHRAQAQFMVSMTRFEALKTVVALEIYQREQGAYPDSLAVLVPQYLPNLPKDVISPNLWERKPNLMYQRQGQSYELVSQSPLYETVRYKRRQSFGPNSPHKLLPLEQ